MRPAWTIFILALVGACGHKGPWTVLERPQADKLREPFSREFPEDLTGYWTPTDRDIAEAEGSLDELMKAEFQRRRWMTSEARNHDSGPSPCTNALR